jgi:hypothetical protein
LPLESTKQVLEALPSLFEEFIDIRSLKFYTKKISKNSYLSFAYDEDKIIKSIKSSKLVLGQINKIYFGQIELEKIFKDSKQLSVKLDNISLSYINDILVKIPDTLSLNTVHTIDISNIELSNDNIIIDSSSKYISGLNALILSVILIISSLLVFTKVFINEQIISEYSNKTYNIKKQNSLPLSTIQTKSIIKTYKKNIKIQIAIRKGFEYILNIRKDLGATLVSVSFKNNKFECKFKNISDKRLKRYINKNYKTDKMKQQNETIIVRFGI